MTDMLADASLIQSLAIGLVIAGVIILGWTVRIPIATSIRRLLTRSAQPRQAPPADTALSTTMEDAEELAQLIADRLDRQAARLEQLIAAADERLTLLNQALSQQPPAAAPPPAPRRDTTDPLSRQIFDLSDRGLPPVEIARQLNQHTGKVELILALRQR